MCARQPQARPPRPYEAASNATPADAGSTDAATSGSGGQAATTECEKDFDCAVRATLPTCDGPTEYRAWPRKEARFDYPRPPLAADGGDCDKEPDRDAKVALCEANRCVLYDTATALAWAKAIVPEIARFESPPHVAVSDAPWFKVGRHVLLYVRGDWRGGDPRTCHGIEFVADENGLHANLLDGDRPAPQYGGHDVVTLAGDASESSEWLGPNGGGSNGWFEELTGYFLSAADDAGVAYEQVDFSVKPRCDWRVVEREGCEPATCRTCAIVLDRRIHNPSMGYGRARAAPVRVPSASCGACLPSPMEALVPRVAAILNDQRYSERSEGLGLRFFRRKAECEAALKASGVSH